MHALRPFAPADAGRWQVAASCRWRSAQRLALLWQIDGDIAALRLPPPQPAARAAALWRHVCFEAFFGPAPAGEAYWELNIAPSGAWALYSFGSYRSACREVGEGALGEVEVERAAQRLRLTAVLDCPRLGAEFAAALRSATHLQVGLMAVLECADGQLGYWALAHTSNRPDFHRRDAFVLQLPVHHPAAPGP
ncbi:MAG: DOMON-like domain-containing protein [Gammaproteobacteria bacterium]|nr:DOMON-like domain-containing protein [Gammaproteobacteria bacterium]